MTLLGVAPVAIQQGQYLPKRILAELKSRTVLDFQYWDKGSMVTIGRDRAVASIGCLPLTGVMTWLIWSLIPMLYLVGFRNRFAVIFLWRYSCIANHRAVRLITADDL